MARIIVNKLQKILLIVSSCCLLIFLVGISLEPVSNGYEISIYDSMPVYYLAFLVIPIILPPIALISARDGTASKRKWMGMLVLLSVISSFVLFILPYLRGYAFYGAGDSLTHLGYVKNIQVSGTVSGDIYPLEHIWIFAINAISDLSPISFSFFINPIFFVLFCLGIFLLAREFGFDIERSIAAISLAIIPVLGVEIIRESLMPSITGFMLIPLVLFLFLRVRRERSLPFSVLLIVMLLAIPPWHPETALILSVLMIVTIAVGITRADGAKPNLNTLALLLVAYIAWFSSTVAFGSTVTEILNSFSNEILTGPLLTRTLFSPVGILGTISFVFFMYGPLIIFLFATFLLIMIDLVRKKLKQRRIKTPEGLIGYLFFASLALSILFLATGMIIGYNMFRLLKYPMLFTVILSSIFLITKRVRKSYGIARVVAVTCIFLVIVLTPTIISVYNTYPSETTRSYNYDNTEADFTGMGYLFSYRDDNLTIIESLPRSFQTRFADAYYGVGLGELKNIESAYDQSRLPLPHFGYNHNLTIGASYSSDTYLICSELTESLYPRIYPEYSDEWPINSSDLMNMSLDITADRVYSSGSFYIIYIDGIRL